MKRPYSAILLIVMMLPVWPGLQTVAAASDNGDRPVRLSTTARFSPIGSMAGRATIDGRAFNRRPGRVNHPATDAPRHELAVEARDAQTEKTDLCKT